ncbi:MAG: YpbF family protein [Bacillaceae bacterium]|nr:YpbF family protein [Bacillaceae bacterium]
METKQIIKKQDYVSDTGLVLVETLIERKVTEQHAEKLLRRATFSTLMCLGLGVIFMLLQGAALNFLTLITSGFLYLYIGLFLICLLFMKNAKKKLDKAEKEYEELRSEVIDRQEQLWDTAELWRKRHELFKFLNEEYKVNLFHK